MHFEVIGPIEQIKTIAVGGRIRDIMRLREQYGPGRWRKLKRVALIRLVDGTEIRAELHWHEAHGLGRRKMKIKQFVE